MRCACCAAVALVGWCAWQDLSTDPPASEPAEAHPVAGEIGADTHTSTGLADALRRYGGSGLLRADYFRASRTFDDPRTDLFGATAQLEVAPKITESLTGKAQLRVGDFALGRGGDLEHRLVEAYATYRFKSGVLRVGRQILAWGRADGLNPTDNLTPRDFAVALPFDEDQRFGTPAVRLDSFLSQNHTLSFFTTPLFTPSVIPLPRHSYVDDRPARSLSQSELGIKLDRAGEGIDWSVSYYHGFFLLPLVRVLDPLPQGSALALEYPRMSVLGADVARSYGRFGFRGEVAYTETTSYRTFSGGLSPSLYWIAGVDRTFFDNLNLNLQVFQHHIRHYSDPLSIAAAATREAALQNAVATAQRDAHSTGVSWRISDRWLNDTITAEIFAVVNFTRHNSFARPLLTYAVSDNWKVTLGGNFYRGAPDTQFGSLRATGGAFMEVRYGF